MKPDPDGVVRQIVSDERDWLPDNELRSVNAWLNGKPTFTPAAERADVAGDEVAMLRAEIAALHQRQIETLELVNEIITTNVPGWIDTKCERIEHRLRAHVAEKFGEVLGRLDGMLANIQERAVAKLHARGFRFAGEPSPDGQDGDVLPNWRKPDVSKVRTTKN
jgi:hypothetical protein